MTEPKMKLDALRRGLDEVLEEAMQADGAAFGKIRVATPDDSTLEIQVQRGLSDAFVNEFRVVEIGDSCPAATAARLKRRVAIPDVARQSQNDPFVVAVREEGVRALQTTPIIAAQGRVVGTLSTLFTHAYHVSTASAIVLDHCARRAAALIEDHES